MPIRLLALDIDHTLLDHNRQIQPDNIPAVRAAVDAGLEVVLASGRFRPSMLGFESQLGLNGPVIVSNGAMVYDGEGNSLLERFVDKDAFDAVYEFAKANDAHLNVYTETELLFVNTGPWGEIYLKRLHSIAPIHALATDARKQDILKLMLADDPERIKEFRVQLNELLDLSKVNITESEPEYLEVLALGASKGNALEFLAGHLNVRQDEVAAIGDFLNDIEMVEWAGLGGAVANGHPNLLAIADVVVKSNDDGGVAQFIYDYVLPRT